MAPNAPRRLPPDALLPIRFSRLKNLPRYDTVFDDFLVVINIIDEQVQCADTLLKPLFNARPFRGRNNPWQDIKRENLLHPRLLAINIEGDAHLQQGSLRCLLTIT